jgi:hypothetical protein
MIPNRSLVAVVGLGIKSIRDKGLDVIHSECHRS